MPTWYRYPFILTIFFLPAIAVTVDSGATTSFYLLSILGLIGVWFGEYKLSLYEKRLLIGFLLFVICIGLSLINSDDVHESIGSYEKYLRFLLFIPVYIYVRKQKLELAPVLTWGVILGCLVMALVAIYQFHILGIERPHGARNPARFGVTLMMVCLLMWLVMVFKSKDKKILISGLILTCLVLYVIVLNQTRAAMLCVFPFALLLLFYFRNQINKKGMLLIVFLFVISILIFLYPTSPIAQRFYIGFSEIAAFFDNPKANYGISDSWAIRLQMLYIGMLIFFNSPILGTGLRDYSIDAQKILDADDSSLADPFLLSTPHNVFVQLLAETGIVGFSALIIFVCLVPIYIYFKFLMSRENNITISLYALSGLTVIACYMLFGMTNTWLTNNSISIFLILNLVYISNLFLLVENKKIATATC